VAVVSVSFLGWFWVPGQNRDKTDR